MINPILKYLKLDVVFRPVMPIGGWYLRNSPRMITCREFNDWIYEHVDGNLSAKQIVLFKRHEKFCPMCRNFLKTYIATYKAEGEICPFDDLDVSSDVPQGLIEAIRQLGKNNDA